MSSMLEVANVLRTLESETGRLDPELVVDAARDPTSPLHPFFEWDDSEAARQHRIGQARQLIRRVRIDVTVHDVPLQVVRYVPDREDGVNSYRDILRVRGDADIARAVIVDEMARVAKAARRAKSVAAVLGVASDIDQIEVLAAIVQTAAMQNQEEGGAAA